MYSATRQNAIMRSIILEIVRLEAGLWERALIRMDGSLARCSAYCLLIELNDLICVCS